jgi:hypothetical protein
LLREGGRIALSFELGRKREALAAGTMVADILGEEVCAPGCGPAPLLWVHVGECSPTVPDGVQCLVVPPAATIEDTAIRPAREPWAACSPLVLAGLGWASGREGEPVVESDQGPLCSRTNAVWRLNADLPGVYARESPRHMTASADTRAILTAQLAMRAVLAEIVDLPPRGDRAASLLTVDAEDQQRYFINREGVCSNISGAPSDDLQFARSCRTIMDRCEAFGLKAVFMVTGDEIAPSFRDAFGDPLIGLDDNRRVLDEMVARGHDVACHGFDHEWWLSKGKSAITPMTTGEKLRYYFATSGDVRMLPGLARFLIRHAPRLLRARAATNARRRTSGQPFTYEEVASDIERWMELVGFRGERLFIRYPGYVRSAATLAFLDDRFAATVDSSDLYELGPPLPAFPYRLLAETDGVLRRTRIVEVPCLWIDRLLRTPDPGEVEAQLGCLKVVARFPGSVLSFVTHTKVVGGAWGHCHVYLHDPFKGMALPMIRASWERFAGFLAERTASSNWRDLQRALFGNIA